jgi:hypothetical protein
MKINDTKKQKIKPTRKQTPRKEKTNRSTTDLSGENLAKGEKIVTINKIC